MKTFLKIILALAIVLAIVYIAGPKAKVQALEGEYTEVPSDPLQLEVFIQNIEDTVSQLKIGNEAKIIWADSLLKGKTPYSIVYIHGFGASQMEGDPVHRKIAEHFHANLYVVRLPEHGIDRPNGMEYLSAQLLTDAVRQAYMIGKSLGDEVIVIGTSMGGALSLLLASERPDMKALVVYSPAIREYGEALQQFFNPWAKFLASNFVMENGVRTVKRDGDKAKYWSETYHVNGYEALAVLLRSKMVPETFQAIKTPVFLGYFYKNDSIQDFVVSVPKMQEMFQQLGTPNSFKREMAFPETGDHVIASSITSQDWETVLEQTIDFLENVVNLKALQEVEIE
ncbi:alpha/beta hydrolase [Mongoliitalea daihaiensis]|uniref:alpha/beta hydrolase n=1 Tax=Mongoliitalea daihaiensis TaxID=2782006 RepID=UPI001F1E5D9F|nr:alpha/beta hydrolase [Mongoliitalea daihaiensis]UJP64350.1 alpha/beta hydrolase [Mongoliitalea daihaiensis]